MGGVVIGAIVIIVATVIFLKVRRNRLGKQYTFKIYILLSIAFII